MHRTAYTTDEIEAALSSLRIGGKTLPQPFVDGPRHLRLDKTPKQFSDAWPGMPLAERVAIAASFLRASPDPVDADVIMAVDRDISRGGGLRAPIVDPSVTGISDWMRSPTDDGCWMRIREGGDPNVVADRLAFVEKSPRIRVAPYSAIDDSRNWAYGPKGSARGDAPHPDSREWCDDRLTALYGPIAAIDDLPASGGPHP